MKSVEERGVGNEKQSRTIHMHITRRELGVM